MLQEIDQNLLRQVQAHDEHAFAELRTRIEPSVRRFVRRLIGSSEAEDDILQDIFFALYRNLHRIEPIEKLRPYVFGIARRRAYDELRRRKYDTVSLDEEPDDDEYYLPIASSDTPPDEVTHWMLLQVEVQQVMERLPEIQRQVLIMFCEENLSYQEIAGILETNVGTVKSRIHYAKRALRGMLRPATLEAIDAAFS